MQLQQLMLQAQSGSAHQKPLRGSPLAHRNSDIERLQRARPEVLVMHPGPINRGVEMTPDVADGERSVVMEQVSNGLAVRMALLYMLLGEDGGDGYRG
jgi:aspartate carbamoyltransferase catalytic subunit